MTRVRLPTTPVPAKTAPQVDLEGPVVELVGLVVVQDGSALIAERIAALLHRCDSVIAVDDGSTDGSGQVARDAGARLFRLPAPRGEGAALKAGLRLARELGYIGAVWCGDELLSPASVDALCLAHVIAPEALILAVGPGQALAGKEWEAAYAERRDEEPQAYPDWRPPKMTGLPGVVIEVFDRLAETRFSYPWGGPRVLPLQAVLRRDVREDGAGVHIELLARAVVAGIPTIELELDEAPERPALTCRKLSLRLLSRFVPILAKRTVTERMGMGGGYAPPTTSPLVLALAASATLLLSACPPKAVEPVASADCAAAMPQATWPGSGDAEAARDELLGARAGTATILVEQGVEVSDPGLQGDRTLRGILARDGADRLRLRLMSMGFTVLDYVEAGGRWHLTVPPAGLVRGGLAGEPVIPADAQPAADQPTLRPDLIASLLRSIEAGAPVRWQAGTCAVLEELGQGEVVRRLRFEQQEGVWRVALEELIEAGVVALAASFSDWQDVGDGAFWANRWDLEDPARGSHIALLTRKVRLDGLTDAHFAVPDFAGEPAP